MQYARISHSRQARLRAQRGTVLRTLSFGQCFRRLDRYHNGFGRGLIAFIRHRAADEPEALFVLKKDRPLASARSMVPAYFHFLSLTVALRPEIVIRIRAHSLAGNVSPIFCPPQDSMLARARGTGPVLHSSVFAPTFTRWICIRPMRGQREC